MVKMSDDKKLQNMKKDARVSMEKQEYPNGHVYAFVNGKKSFFALDTVVVSKVNGDKITVKDLVGLVEKQVERIDTLKGILLAINEKIERLEKESKIWNG